METIVEQETEIEATAPVDETAESPIDPNIRKEMTKRLLPVILTATDYQKFGKELAEANRKIGALQVDAKNAATQYKAEIGTQEAKVTELSSKINIGSQQLEVECSVYYHYDTRTVKTVRNDTGEQVEVRTMHSYELQTQIPFDQEEEKEEETPHCGAWMLGDNYGIGCVVTADDGNDYRSAVDDNAGHNPVDADSWCCWEIVQPNEVEEVPEEPETFTVAPAPTAGKNGSKKKAD